MRAQRVAVDRILCDGRGICADLLPEMIRLDDWGYPIIDGRPLDIEVVEHARRAVSNCPVRALRLQRVSEPPATPPPTPPSR